MQGRNNRMKGGGGLRAGPSTFQQCPFSYNFLWTEDYVNVLAMNHWPHYFENELLRALILFTKWKIYIRSFQSMIYLEYVSISIYFYRKSSKNPDRKAGAGATAKRGISCTEEN